MFLQDFCPLLALFGGKRNEGIIILACAAKQISEMLSATAVITDLKHPPKFILP